MYIDLVLKKEYEVVNGFYYQFMMPLWANRVVLATTA